MTSRRWCITDNTIEENFNTEDWKDKLPGSCTYAIWQKEKAESGKIHIQAFLKLSKPMRIAGLKKVLGNVHCEQTKGTDEQAANYCRKEETRIEGPFESGELTRQGQRRDLEIVAEQLAKKRRLDDVALENPETYIKFHGGIKALAQVHAREGATKFRNVQVHVIYGKTGVGKTSSILKTEEDLKNTYILEKFEQNLWFDGYQGQKQVIFDDFYGDIKPKVMLRLLDKYPVRLDVKNGFTYANWENVYITSNVHPKEWYSKGDVPEDVLEGIQRRISKIFLCEKGSSLTEVDWAGNKM